MRHAPRFAAPLVSLLMCSACSESLRPGGAEDTDLSSSNHDMASGRGDFVPSPVGSACAGPVVTQGKTITTSSEHAVSPGLARAGQEVALVHASGTFTAAWTISLTRLGSDGNGSAAPVALGTSQAFGVGSTPVVARASDGARYLSCWDGQGAMGTLGCAVVPVGQGGATAGLMIEGTAPSLAAGSGGFVLAYQGSSGVVLQRLGADGNAQGASISVGNATAASPRLVATSSGYALAFAAAQGSDWKLVRLSKDLETVGTPAPLAGSGGAHQLALGASGDRVVAVWAEHSPTQISALVIDESGAPRQKVAVNDQSSALYGAVGAAGGKESFAVSWSDGSGFAGYRALDFDGAAQGKPVTAVGTNWDDNPQDLVAVADGFVLATTIGAGLDSVQLVHLGCP